MLPAVAEKTTSVGPPPPVVRLLLNSSRAWTVITWVSVPLAILVAVAGLMVECAALAKPGLSVMTVEDASTAVPTAVSTQGRRHRGGAGAGPEVGAFQIAE